MNGECQSIITYKDDEKITKGKKISDELIRSIQDSRFYIIVFSKNYASSSWCLDELVKIMECHKTNDHTAYPVFYDVEPTEVRNQIGSVGEAFFKHENDEAAEKWRHALKGAADLAGWELKNTADGHEAKFIQKIVQEISLELRVIDSSVDGKLIGMESRVKNVVSALETGCDDVRMIGIKGMGGAGKTTLARAVFDQMSIHFEGKSFVENVREVSKASLSGLKKLQKQILSDVLNDRGSKISSVHDGKTMLKKMMCGRKILVVLDDVDNVEQLEALAGDPNWFKPGSRIIITTRDEQVLVAHGVNLIRDINLLSDEEAVCLFSRYAFGKDIPIQGYEELSGNVVRYAAGLPLTIRVLGSFLCGKTRIEWEDALERLKTIPLKDTLEKLEISYIGLEGDYKEIFLDVACIMKGWEKETAVQALESCGFHARNGLRVLEQKSLITTTSKYGLSYLGMHDHIEEMGKNIVRRLQPNEPRLHSRLWIPKEIQQVLSNDSGNDAIQCIRWSVFSNDYETYMSGLRNMKKLRVLHIYYHGIRLASQCFFPKALRYLKWDGYHSQSLMKSFQADNLVGLFMPDSRIMQFWKSGETKVLHKLRFLDMSHSDLTTLDLQMTPNVETLNLKRCSHFLELNMPLGRSKLKALYLRDTGLRTLNLEPTPDLETLDLHGCKDLAELTIPYQCPKLKFLRADFSKLKTLDLRLISNLETLSLEYCHDLVELHMPNDCPMLKSLYLKCSRLRSLNLVSAPNLDYLDLDECHGLVELHMPSRCPKLRSLSLYSYKLRTLDLGLISDLEILNLKKCDGLEELHMPNGCPNLKSLILENSNLRKINLGQTPVLETLSLVRCFNLEELHMPNRCPNLKSFIVENSNMKRINLGLTQDLKTLRLKGCHELVELHLPFKCPKVEVLSLDCSKLRTIYHVHSPHDLETLSLEGRCQLLELRMPNEFPKLKSLSLNNLQLRSLTHVGLTRNLARLIINEKFVYLNLSEYGVFKSFSFDKQSQSPAGSLHVIAKSIDTGPMPSDSNLPKFRFSCLYEEPISSSTEYYLPGPLTWADMESSPLGVYLGSSLHKRIGELDLGRSNYSICRSKEKIEYYLGKFISIGICSFTNLESFSESICNLQGLRKLTLECSFPEVPKDLDRLQSLEELSLSSTDIKHLPDSICMLKNLKLLEVNSCWFLENLPEDLGRLECLEDLNVTSCIRLQDIPKSICDMRRLKRLNLSSCLQVKRLPREIGRLKCLEELSIKDTGIIDLPDVIFEFQGLKLDV